MSEQPSPRAVVAAAMSEDEFQAQIVALAEATNWLCYHTHDSRRSQPGFPDLVLVRGSAVLFLEVKAEKGKLSPAQLEWMVGLKQAQYVHAATVRPSDWDEVERLLTGTRRP